MKPHNCTGHVYELSERVKCCARLVISARPSATHQRPMLEHASRYWPREEIIKEIENAG